MDHKGRIRTRVVWGQGIPLRPAMTIQHIGPAKKHQAVQTTSQVSGVHSSILSNILPGHASVTDAVTRLQREWDLALRRIDELHAHHKKEIEKKDEADRKSTLINMEVRNNQVREAQKETAHYKKQFENAMSLVKTQKLSIKMLLDELGEEAEFDAEETAQMRSVRRECETRVNRYEDRIAELQSDIQKEIDKQANLLKKITKERDAARSELNESQQSARSLFNEQKRLEKSEDRLKDEVSRSNKAVDKMREETIRLRSKVNELQHEKSDLIKQHESHLADEEDAAAERVTVLLDL
jgi:chromosome segregation ATPase